MNKVFKHLKVFPPSEGVPSGRGRMWNFSHEDEKFRLRGFENRRNFEPRITRITRKDNHEVFLKPTSESLQFPQCLRVSKIFVALRLRGCSRYTSYVGTRTDMIPRVSVFINSSCLRVFVAVLDTPPTSALELTWSSVSPCLKNLRGFVVALSC